MKKNKFDTANSFNDTSKKIISGVIALSLVGIGIETNLSPVLANNSPVMVAQNSQEKVRLAVMDFDYSSISNPSYLNLIEGAGRGVSDVVVTELVETGKYRVIERSRLNTVLQEQNLGASGRMDASTAAEIGRLLGVELVMLGSITQFDLQDRNTGFGMFGFGFGNQTKKALVTINSRLVNTTTGEILMTAEGKAEVAQVDGQVRVRGVGVGTSTNNDATLLTVATQDAVKQIITKMEEKQGELSTIAKVLPTTSGLIADVSGNTVVINKGNQHGYGKGLKLSIERVSREIKDPATGKVIRRVTSQLGIVELTEVDGTSSVGKVVKGAGFKVGDIASPMQ